MKYLALYGSVVLPLLVFARSWWEVGIIIASYTVGACGFALFLITALSEPCTLPKESRDDE